MVDVLAIPLYYISFQKSVEIEYHYQDAGFKNIHHFQAIDGRKFHPMELLEENKISIRCYNDLVGGRHQHTGMSSIGGVGCTMSHCALWQLCIDQNLPYIIITEEDNRMNALNSTDLEKISQAIQQPNGMFVSSQIGSNTDSSRLVWGDNDSYAIHFTGLNFYVISQGACRELVKYCYPIDVQTDWYIANIATRGKIKVSGYPIARQLSHVSSIQDSCIKCTIPQKIYYYKYIIGVILFILLIAVVGTFSSAWFRSRWKQCEDSCSASRMPIDDY